MDLAAFWADPRVSLSGVALLLLGVVCAGLRPGQVVSEGDEPPAAAVDPFFFEPIAQPLPVAPEGPPQGPVVQPGNTPPGEDRTAAGDAAEPRS